MSWFSTRQQNDTHALLVHIGSGSVSLTIINNNPTESEALFAVVWSHREFILIRETTSTERNLQEIQTAFINAILVFNSARNNDETFDTSLHVAETIVTVSAPWIYSIIKNVVFAKEQPFSFTRDLLEDIAKTADQKATESVLGNEVLSNTDLKVITTKSLAIYANGYPVKLDQRNEVRKVEIAHLTSLTRQALHDSLTENLDQLFPRSRITIAPFVVTFYDAIESSAMMGDQYVLCSITSEATEIGIVTEGVLRKVTHAPIGTRTIMRAIAATLKVPPEEASLYMQQSEVDEITTLTESKQAALQEILADYQAALAQVITETEYNLILPNKFILHVDKQFYEYFQTTLTDSAKTFALSKITVTNAQSLCFNSKAVKNLTACITLQGYISNQTKA